MFPNEMPARCAGRFTQRLEHVISPCVLEIQQRSLLGVAMSRGYIAGDKPLSIICRC